MGGEAFKVEYKDNFLENIVVYQRLQFWLDKYLCHGTTDIIKISRCVRDVEECQQTKLVNRQR